ncbi:hypothetical protein CXB77_06070 (plasmid) [Chromatium okenii]|uniref:Uncharacterized protein n=1 Tax=Chromatium okenii TaxID=61644 RepID=A0A2S7XT01_9GAMM|nr:hypothetical protein CXB77_05995 [Chromatium okenii]PQJ96766.1 hypothetical protein CXB77_06070 [Chromatium okenii]
MATIIFIKMLIKIALSAIHIKCIDHDTKRMACHTVRKTHKRLLSLKKPTFPADRLDNSVHGRKMNASRISDTKKAAF